jgi:hypothetical protein
MKGMRKISRGKSFKGVMKYAFDGDLKNPRELEGEVVGGNVTSRDPQGLTKEFNVSRAVRPDVKNAVWHNSLRLPEGDQVSKETWAKIGDRYMEKMGFSDAHQRVYVLHDDKEGQHIHVVASRVALDGKLFLGKNENLKSTRVIAELEKEFNLTITKGVSYDEAGKIVMPEKSKVTKGEMEKALRTGTEPPRVQLQKLVDQALTDKPSATQFIERLQAAGVDVVPNIASTGKLNGFKFGLDGVFFSGSKLGDNYKYSKLQSRGLTYDQERESGFLRQLNAEAGIGAEHGRPAQEDRHLPGVDREAGPARGRDGGELRRDLGQGAGTDEPGLGGDHEQRPGHSEPDRPGVAEADPRGRESRPGAEAVAGAEASGERPSADRGHRAASPDIAGDGGGAAEISTGIDISDAGFIRTGNKGSDELLSAAHKNRLKGERERIAADRKKWDGHGDNVKQMLAAMRRPFAAQLTRSADISRDVTAYRQAEISQFAKALGAERFQVVCTSSNPKEKPISRVFTAAELQNPSTIKSMAHMASRRYDVSIRPDPAAGVLLVKGLDADGIKKLEAVGLQPAAVIDVAGKCQAWIATGSTLSEDERKALTKRLETLTGVEQKHGGAGGLVGFSNGQKTVSLATCPGQVAPAAGDLVAEIKVAVFEAKAALQLAKLVDKNAVLRPDRDIDTVGTIKSLRSSWMRDKVAAVRDEAQMWGKTHDPAQIERAVVGAMARQKVPAHQAFRAVFEDSGVNRGDARHAADIVAQEYTRSELIRDGQPVVDLETEAQKRHADLYKRANSGSDAELKAIQEQARQEAIQEQQRLDEQEEKKRLELLERRAAERLESGLDRSPTLGR